jgi:drug/metabolite transporter (DMT)-like permease
MSALGETVSGMKIAAIAFILVGVIFLNLSGVTNG